MNWEYKIEQLGFKVGADARERLDAAGNDGWELVTIFPKASGLDEYWGMAIYKRPKDR